LNPVSTKFEHNKIYKLITKRPFVVFWEIILHFSILRVFLSILFRLSDPCENWILGYFGYAGFKNLISLALGRRILELAIFAWNTVLQVLLTEK